MFTSRTVFPLRTSRTCRYQYGALLTRSVFRITIMYWAVVALKTAETKFVLAARSTKVSPFSKSSSKVSQCRCAYPSFRGQLYTGCIDQSAGEILMTCLGCGVLVSQYITE
jgi:hypothetical protein